MHSVTENDMFRELHLRVPIGNRIATDSAALNWGAPTEANLPGDSILSGDCAPYTRDEYGNFCADGNIIYPWSIRGMMPLLRLLAHMLPKL